MVEKTEITKSGKETTFVHPTGWKVNAVFELYNVPEVKSVRAPDGRALVYHVSAMDTARGSCHLSWQYPGKSVDMGLVTQRAGALAFAQGSMPGLEMMLSDAKARLDALPYPKEDVVLVMAEIEIIIKNIENLSRSITKWRQLLDEATGGDNGVVALTPFRPNL